MKEFERISKDPKAKCKALFVWGRSVSSNGEVHNKTWGSVVGSNPSLIDNSIANLSQELSDICLLWEGINVNLTSAWALRSVFYEKDDKYPTVYSSDILVSTNSVPQMIVWNKEINGFSLITEVIASNYLDLRGEGNGKAARFLKSIPEFTTSDFRNLFETRKKGNDVLTLFPSPSMLLSETFIDFLYTTSKDE
jgi:hypothetical protein